MTLRAELKDYEEDLMKIQKMDFHFKNEILKTVKEKIKELKKMIDKGDEEMSKKFVMTIEIIGEDHLWEECKGQTLRSALIEATKRYKGYWSGGRIVVAEKINGQNYVLASKKVKDKEWFKRP